MLIDTHTAAVQVLAHVEGRRCVEHAPLDVAIRQDIGVRERSAIVLSSPIEQSIGNLSGRIARLGRTIIELGELEIPVAVGTGREIRAPDRRFKRPIVIQDAPNPLGVAEDQTWQPSRRVGLRDGGLVASSRHVKRNPSDTSTVVGEIVIVVDIQGRASHERVIRITDVVQIGCRVGRQEGRGQPERSGLIGVDAGRTDRAQIHCARRP